MMFNKSTFIVVAPVVALFSYFLFTQLGLAHQPAAAAAVAVLTVIWWVTEALPIPATSIVPFALLPMLGVVDHKTVASAFGSHVILLLMGAFMLSKALEKSGVHERLAVYMVKLVGTHSAKRLVLGFMLAAGILSMWISNTATTLIMLPIAMAILAHIDNERLKVALVLGIAYAASVGGIGTPIGTPPNVIFMGIYEEFTGQEFGFFEWMKIGVPVVLITLPIMALWLTRGLSLKQEITLPTQGHWRSEEKRTLIIFGITAIAWVTRSAPFGGWAELLDVPIAGDSTVALLAVVVMFMVPNGKGGRVLDWHTAKDIPWGMLLLFAGGIALAKGFTASGLSQLMGEWLVALDALPIFLMLAVLCLCVTYLTEITSNTATATLLMPILAAAAIAIDVNPALLMVPAAMCASSAFMLPVATAPNAIAYGSGLINIKQMVKEGAMLSFIVSLLIATINYLYW
ncbi:SLC13 family permease [Thalassotalea agarivorans]|uniref:SLC13 family permease n=1 Tax=Thalassotalea agarivorans TaxID=349064 RepID=UPI00389B1641